MIRPAVIGLMCMLPAPVFCQMVAGKVVDLAERRPLVGVSVVLRNVVTDSVSQSVTDRSGMFNFFPSEGRYVLGFRRGPDFVLHADTLVLTGESEFQRLFVLDFPPPTDVMAPQDVERQVVPLTRFRIPYPESVRNSGLEGVVVMQFVVDTTGRILPETIRIIRSTDEAFSQAVREALASARFRPASHRGRKVRQLVRLPFHFCLAQVTVRIGPSSARTTSVDAPSFPQAECERSR